MADKGFFGSLFDFSFTEFITPRIIKLLFVLAIIISGIAALVLFVSGIAGGGAGAFLAIIGAPLLFLLYVIMARVWLELIMVMFHIADNTDKLVESPDTQATPDQE
jgi:uncharacterized membrane protein